MLSICIVSLWVWMWCGGGWKTVLGVKLLLYLHEGHMRVVADMALRTSMSETGA